MTFVKLYIFVSLCCYLVKIYSELLRDHPVTCSILEEVGGDLQTAGQQKGCRVSSKEFLPAAQS